MRVGVDARCLSRQLTGIGYYCLSVIRELEKRDIELVLFSPSPILFELAEGTIEVSSDKTGVLGRQIWGELSLPLMLKKYDIDVFWGPAHRIPFFMSNSFPSVLTIHDLVWCKVPETMALRTRLLERFLMPPSLKKADLILADSSSTVEDINEFFPECSSKTRHVPIAIGSISEELPSSNQVDISKSYLLFVGTFEPRKNLQRILIAYSQLSSETRERYQLVLVGGQGWGGFDLNAEIKRLNISDNVTVFGYQSTQHLSWLYKNAYCLVFPSIYEGFGMPILEANSFGVPVITSNLSSMPEVAGDAAILVDPLSIKDITKGMNLLLTNQSLRSELSKKAVENASKYSWRKTTDYTVDAFADAIALKKRN